MDFSDEIDHLYEKYDAMGIRLLGAMATMTDASFTISS